MADLSLSNVINISVSLAPAGIGEFNVNNACIITDDAPSISPPGGYTIYKNPTDVGTDYGTDSQTYKMAVALFSQRPNILAGGGYLVIAPFTDGSETLVAAITRVRALISFYGVITTKDSGSTQVTNASNYVQTQNMALFTYSALTSVLAVTTGLFWQLSQAQNNNTRCLYYGLSDFDTAGLMAAAYMGRAMSTNFGGSNTCQTMHLKTLVGILADTSMTQTLLTTAIAAGADTYPSLEGVPKVFTSGINKFWDQVYNLAWYVSALQVAGFNALATSSSKVPQTEAGVGVLTTAYRGVSQQAVRNGYFAPGAWASPDTFGNQDDFIRNIDEVGFYIYTLPVALQAQAAREARECPLAQIAGKEAGAIQEADVLITINA